MLAVRVVVSFIAGALLYQSAVVFVGGMLATIAVPKAYLEWFGRSNVEFALVLQQFIVFALPIGVLVAGGTLSIQRLFSRSPKPVLLAILSGLVTCFVYCVAVGALVLPTDQPAESYPPEVLLKQLMFPPWWATSAFLAPWLGFTIAAWLVLSRRKREA